MKIAISGHSRSGKDIAAEWFTAHCGLRYFGSTSKAIWPHAAARLGLSLREAWQRRHEQRQVWFDIGKELGRDDTAYLAREVLRQGELCVGVRSRGEMQAVVDERLVDVLLWVDRDVPDDPTLEYGVDDFPFVVIRNHGTLSDFYARLEWLARGLGIFRPQPSGYVSTSINHQEHAMDFKQYRRTGINEMADWTPDTDMSGVSVSDADQANGSPQAGDKIARNPANHADKWLVAAAYFEKNFEPA